MGRRRLAYTVRKFNDGFYVLLNVAAPGALIGEIDQRLAATETDRDRNIFWLYYRQGYTARDIASIPNLGLTQKGVESCIYRLTQSVRNTVAGSATGAGKGLPPQNTLGVMK